MKTTVVEAMTAVIETDLGLLHVAMEENFGLTGRISEIVTINRVDYGIDARFYLDRQTEEWRVATWAYRVQPTKSDFYALYKRGDDLYERVRDGREATPAAYKQIKEHISKAFHAWIDSHYLLVIDGHHRALLRRVQEARQTVLSFKAHADSGLERITHIEQSVLSNLPLSDDEKSFLSDVSNHYYRRW